MLEVAKLRLVAGIPNVLFCRVPVAVTTNGAAIGWNRLSHEAIVWPRQPWGNRIIQELEAQEQILAALLHAHHLVLTLEPGVKDTARAAMALLGRALPQRIDRWQLFLPSGELRTTYQCNRIYGTGATRTEQQRAKHPFWPLEAAEVAQAEDNGESTSAKDADQTTQSQLPPGNMRGLWNADPPQPPTKPSGCWS